VDIVCRDGDTLIFVEVKTRTRDDFGRPLEAIDAAKRKLIARGALAWLQLLDNPDVLFRFDVVEVMLTDRAVPQIELLRDAFQLPSPYIY
jgi:Predicted endonuclease distantly related to archaeal Holliday junction resolvase